MITKVLLKKLKEALKEYENPNFINPDLGYNNLLVVCKDILIDSGYRVVDPFKFSLENIKKHKDLILLFYGLLGAKYPNRLPPSTQYFSKTNLRIASSFVKSRMTSKDISKKTALYECAEIINTLVCNLETIGVNQDSLSFTIFGQDALGWITTKAVDILNNNSTIKSEAQAEKLVEFYINEIKKEISLGYDIDDIDGILKEEV